MNPRRRFVEGLLQAITVKLLMLVGIYQTKHGSGDWERTVAGGSYLSGVVRDITTHEDESGRVDRYSSQTTHVALHMTRRIEKEETAVAEKVMGGKLVNNQAFFEINLL